MVHHKEYAYVIHVQSMCNVELWMHIDMNQEGNIPFATVASNTHKHFPFRDCSSNSVIIYDIDRVNTQLGTMDHNG